MSHWEKWLYDTNTEEGSTLQYRVNNFISGQPMIRNCKKESKGKNNIIITIDNVSANLMQLEYLQKYGYMVLEIFNS
jgi:hypothetical protein